MTTTTSASDSASCWSWVTSRALAPAARRMARTSSRSVVRRAASSDGERLVEQHHLGVGGQRPGERDPLALAAGQLVRVRAGAIGEADQFEALVDTLTGRLSPNPTLPHHA